jgi:hypothetical protein
MRNLILKYSAILLTLQVLIYFAIDPLNLLQTIPNTPIKIHGLLLAAVFLGIIYFFQTRVLKLYPQTTIFKLTLSASLIIMLSEAVFQIIKQFSLTEYTLVEHIFDYIKSVAVMSAFALVFSFLEAYRLIKKNTPLFWVFIIIFVIVANILIRLFPEFVK